MSDLRGQLQTARGRFAEGLAIVDALLEAEAEAAPAPSPVVEDVSRAVGLQKAGAFYDVVRGDAGELWPRMSQSQFDGCEAVLHACAGRLPLSWTAYALATTYHETGYSMQPIHELGGPKYLSKYDTGKLAAQLGNTPAADGDGILYAGRGYVMLTGLRNYRHATERLRELGFDVDLVKNPDDAMKPDVAAAILVFGMLEGWFTGKSFRVYLPNNPTRTQYTNARRIINGTDRADKIAGYAIEFERALRAGDWR